MIVTGSFFDGLTAVSMSLNRVARELGLDPATVQREAERLEEAGILASDRIGRARLVRPNEESPFYPELSGLVLKAFGPVPSTF